MRLEEYSPDAICKAMSLPGFIEEEWAEGDNPTVRLVLTPSFHPELCITISRSGDGTSMSVVSLKEQLWAQRSWIHIPSEGEEVNLPSGVFDEILSLFNTAHGSVDPERHYVCLDGMGSEACNVSRAGTKRFRAHQSTEIVTDRFAALLIE